MLACHDWLVDIWAANPQSFMDSSRLRQPAMYGDLDAVKWLSCFCLARIILLRESCHTKRFDSRSQSFSGRSECPTSDLGGVNRFPGLSEELRSNHHETISNRVVHRESNHSRGTIHPHPEGLRSSLPLDPNEIKWSFNDGSFTKRKSKGYWRSSPYGEYRDPQVRHFR